jgi:hypothetical protein
MPRTITFSEAVTRFDEIIDEIAETGDPIFVESDGGPGVVILPAAAVRHIDWGLDETASGDEPIEYGGKKIPESPTPNPKRPGFEE